jgi:hypothetical protein
MPMRDGQVDQESTIKLVKWIKIDELSDAPSMANNGQKG